MLRRSFLQASLAAVPVLWAGAARAAEAAVSPIVHPSCALEGVTFDELHAYALLERQYWPDGKRVVLLLPPSASEDMAVLLAKLYKMSEAEVRRHFKSALFAGRIAGIPSVVRTREAALRVVSQSPGALSFVGGPVGGAVKALAIDGQRAGGARYPL